MDRTNTIVTNLLEGFRGWVSPSGQQLETGSGEDHGNHADRILDRAYPAWEWERSKRFTEQGVSYPTIALEYKGWIRVVDDGIYSVYKLTPAVVSSLEELINEIEDDTPVIIGVAKGRSLPRSPKEEALRWLGMVTEDAGEEDDDFKEVYGEPERPQYLPLGTIIQGTMQIEDIIPAFLHVLKSFDPAKAADLESDYTAIPPDQRDEFGWERVLPALEKFAPPYTYVGGHQGNASDYGVWVDTDTLDDVIKEWDTAQILVIKKGHPIPRGKSEYVLVLDDDGSYLSFWDGKTGVKLWDESSEPVAEAMKVWDRYVLEHRLVCALSIGRPLKSSEKVHHQNGLKQDNRLENLLLMTEADHASEHWRTQKALISALKRIKELEFEIARLREQPTAV